MNLGKEPTLLGSVWGERKPQEGHKQRRHVKNPCGYHMRMVNHNSSSAQSSHSGSCEKDWVPGMEISHHDNGCGNKVVRAIS